MAVPPFFPLQQPAIQAEVRQNRQGYDTSGGDEEHAHEDDPAPRLPVTLRRIGRQRQCATRG